MIMKKFTKFFLFLLYVLSLKVTYLLLLQPLDVNPAVLSPQCKAIVVLGGRDDYDRILKGLEISQYNNTKPIIFSGVHKKYKNVVKSFDLGNVVFEDRSKNTYQNAKFTKQLLSKRDIDSICLVSSQTHLFRAKRVYEKFNLKVLPIVSAKVSKHIHLGSFLPDLKYFNLNIAAIYEYLAIVYYKLNKRI